MMVIITEAVPAMLRGRLALWLLEVRAGVYVGKYSKKTRENLWNECKKYHGDGNVVIVWQTPTESGFSFATLGENRRVPSDHDGIQLVRFLPLLTSDNAQQFLGLELGDENILDAPTQFTWSGAESSSHNDDDDWDFDDDYWSAQLPQESPDYHHIHSWKSDGD